LPPVAYSVTDLTKTYPGRPVPANDRISLKIDTGMICAVLGPNGAGKTTLVRQMTGLLRPSSGRVELFGMDVGASPEAIPDFVAYYGQRALALNAHRLEEVLWITGLLRGQTYRVARAQAAELMERFQVSGLARQLLARLSGGERRLAGLLSTFMGCRPILVLDEPTNDIDPVRRELLWTYLHDRNAAHGDTVIVVSHNLPEVETVAHRAVLIDQGRVAAEGTLGDLKRAVADEVRLELRLRFEDERTTAVMAAWPNARKPRPGLWVIRSSPAEASAVLQAALEKLGAGVIDDFRLITPSLNDVYMHFTGKEVRSQ
jgi:ABC-2 type transport system ATP-binding protein